VRTVVILSALVLSPVAFAQTVAPAVADSCPVTLTEDYAPFQNSALRTSLWPEGRVVFEPGGPGFIEDDGSLGMKWAWERFIEGPLSVGGRRLDGEAPPARSYIPFGYGNLGFQSTYLVFPTPGCWEITGGVAGRSLSFIVLVEKIGEGPDWHRTGPDPGRRVTSNWQDPGIVVGASER
jgi:hypothetical protein